jgi:hypothetical protein
MGAYGWVWIFSQNFISLLYKFPSSKLHIHINFLKISFKKLIRCLRFKVHFVLWKEWNEFSSLLHPSHYYGNLPSIIKQVYLFQENHKALNPNFNFFENPKPLWIISRWHVPKHECLNVNSTTKSTRKDRQKDTWDLFPLRHCDHIFGPNNSFQLHLFHLVALTITSKLFKSSRLVWVESQIANYRR